MRAAILLNVLVLSLLSPAPWAQTAAPDPAPAPAPAVTPDGPIAPKPAVTPGDPAALPASPAAEKNPREQELLQRIQQLKAPPWRTFGACRYDWASWRLIEEGVRVTQLECGDPGVKGTVAVHCDTLRINRRMGSSDWETWRFPFSAQESSTAGGEDVMVATLCANITTRSTPPAPKAAPASTAPAQASPTKTVPAAKPSTTPKRPPAPGVPSPVAPKP